MLDLSDDAVGRLVGWEALFRGLEYQQQDRVLDLRWSHSRSVLDGEVQGTRADPYHVNILFSGEDPTTASIGICACPVHVNCKHVAAVLVAAREPASAGASSWERLLRPLAREQATGGSTPLALQFDFSPGRHEVLRVRPLIRGRRGRWIRGQVGWNAFALSRPQDGWDPQQHQQLSVLRTLGSDDGSGRHGWKRFDDLPSKALWSVLQDVVDAGVRLLGDEDGSPVTLDDRPARLQLDASRTDGQLVLVPQVEFGTGPSESMSVIGRPPQLVLDHGPDGLLLALLERPVAPAVAELLARRERLSVPQADEGRFLADYYPQLRRAVPVRSRDRSFDPPAPREPVLALELRARSDHQLELRWDWWYRRGTDDPGERYSLVVAPGSGQRDLEAEHRILTDLDLKRFDLLLDRSSARSLLSRNLLRTDDMIDFLTEVLPELEDRDGLEIIYAGQLPEYAEAVAPPLVKVRTEHIRGERDWFELSVTIEVDGEKVPFTELFTALAAGRHRLVLPSGTYVSLDRPEFEQLAALIVEARDVGEPRADGVKISRYQVDWFAELESLGVDTEQAGAWRRVVQNIGAGATPERVAQPSGFTATLRDYQRDGLDWLVFLHDQGLGGVLADDMGLGKTLQALALICHAREQQPAQPPFLVVAPTSVVGNWQQETERFAPGLKVVVITETERRAGSALARRIAGADIVLSSYTLLRIDAESYQQQDWAGVLLDEAQFVKNHRSRAYQCVRRLAAPFKLAITGTPLENNLMELWSMFSITAPGLFGGPTQFRDEYAKPIERNQDQPLLDRLRRRIRPLMLRRTKDQVAGELPQQQEQVISLDLLPKHRKVYDTHLHRERQKILGLLEDLEGNRFEVFRSLTLLRQLSLDASLHDDKYADVPSTKLEALGDLVTEILAEQHRVLIFSQFTGFLSHVAEVLRARDVDYAYLDGRTKDRPRVIEDFKSGDKPAFLISLKAGGFGLNLTEADYCILLDPWWNPATEQQAIDRIHRIGQTRNVMVYRLVARDTIEEKVMALKADKAKLFANVMDGGAAGTSAALTAGEIRELIA